MKLFLICKKPNTYRIILIFVLSVFFENLSVIADEVFAKLEIQRQSEFEFVSKPTIKKSGDAFQINFETKSYCDIAIAIEDTNGNIVRHLASGVLGANAPLPFAKNSKVQSIVWDGKNDIDQYVNDNAEYFVRVSLGLKAQFERTMFWSPHKKSSLYPDEISMQAHAEGVYVLDSGQIGPGFAPHLKLFTHKGEYQNTIYPFAANQIENIMGLEFQTFAPDNKKFPVKWGYGQLNLLTAGAPDINATIFPSGKSKEVPIQTFVVQKGQEGLIYIIGKCINRFPKNQNKLNLPLKGPVVEISFETADPNPSKSRSFLPESAALSPDGKWMYLTGYKFRSHWNAFTFLQCVMRVDPKGDTPPTLFAGKISADTDLASDEFVSPTSVACDAVGNVYVCDYMNDRIKVFSSDGKLFKTLNVKKPAKIEIDEKSGELFVFSWQVKSSVLLNKLGHSSKEMGTPEEQLTILKSLENPEVKANINIPTKRPEYLSLSTGRSTIFNDDNKTWVWLAKGNGLHSSHFDDAYAKMNAVIYSLDKNKKGEYFLNFEKDFNAEVVKKIIQDKPARHGRQRLYSNPEDGKVYLGELVFPHPEHFKSIDELISLDPISGSIQKIPLPFNSEDLAFDIKGHAYLRTENWIVRYDLKSLKEVPFDYGQEGLKVGYHDNGKTTAVISGLRIAGKKGDSSFQLGGMDVAMNGNIAATFHYTAAVENNDKNSYKPYVFPGRDKSWVIHIWDKFGKIKYEDAFPGMKRPSDIALDNDNYLYALTRGVGSENGKSFENLWSTTLIKVKAKGGKVLTDRDTVIPLPTTHFPDRNPELTNANGYGGKAWVENFEWLYGGVGIDGKGPCHCEANSQLVLDYFKRSFVVETHRSDIVVIDSAGNTVLRIGKYGNIEDGVPLIKEGGPLNVRSIGGDEVAIVSVKFLATHTDKRLFLADIGNQRLLSVKLSYHVEEKVKVNTEVLTK